MASSASSASTIAVHQPQAQLNGKGPQQPAPPRRKKGPPTIFQKKPSRPFAIAEKDREREMQMRMAAEKAAMAQRQVEVKKEASTPRASPKPQADGDAAAAGPSSTKAGTPPVVKSSGSPAPTPPGSQTTSSAAPSPSEPQLGYQEFRLVSCDRQGWDYEMMRFESRKAMDIMSWRQPIKLNRKELRRDPPPVTEGAPVPVRPMLGPDGKPVIGSDGKLVMLDAEGKPITNTAPQPPPASGGAAKTGFQKKKFQKKTRQVFLAPEHIRQLRKEERYPWILEDANGEELWEGRMEETAKTELYGLFIPSSEDAFQFIPAHRSYKFQRRRAQALWSLEEAEKMMAKMQKSRDPERWAVRQRNAGAAGTSLVHEASAPSLAPGGRRLRAVDSGGRRAFEEDDEEGMASRREREREREREGDIDEMEYEEEFADDEEKMDLIPDDEETKELEERLKREYRSANKTTEGYIDADEEEEDDELTGAGKAIKKLMRKNDQDGVYDSDEDKNPYASSEEEEEEEPVDIPTGPAVQEQQKNGSTGQAPTTPANKTSGTKTPSRPDSRGGSPAPSTGNIKIKSEATPVSLVVPVSPGSPPVSPGGLGMGGHSIVAKRATSPKAPKLKTPVPPSQNGSRAASPLAGSRAASPGPVSPGVGTSLPSKKRKAEDGTATPGAPGGATPKLKKSKPALAGAPATPAATTGSGAASTTSAPVQIEPGTELTGALLASWLRGKTVTTRECIQYFQPCLTDDTKKTQFTQLVKEIASLKNGMLVLKPQYK